MLTTLEGYIMNNRKKTLIISFICGMLGCLCFGSSDWLMIYGDTAHSGSLYWLTDGAVNIAPWRNSLAMFLAFPGIIFYGIGLFAAGKFITDKKSAGIYKTLNIYGLTPWICLHLFYVMIIYLYSWMMNNGYAEAALPSGEALFSHLSWIIMLSEVFMLPPFIYWFILQISGKTEFPKAMAFTNVLVIYGVLYAVKSIMPDSPFRIGFTNGLMSESMIIWFAILLVHSIRSTRNA